MAKKFIIKNGALEIFDTVLLENDYVLPLKKLWYLEKVLQDGGIQLTNLDAHEYNIPQLTTYDIVDCQNSTGVTFTADTFRLFAETYFTKAGAQDVVIQDSTSPKIIGHFSNVAQETTLAQPGGDITTFVTDIVVTDATGFIAGQYLSIFNVAANRFYIGDVLDVNGATISMDSPLDFNYPAGSFVTVGSKNMAVDGSVTPQIFGLRNTDQAIGASYDITRLMFYGQTTSLGSLEKFGNIANGLEKGIVIRKVDGEYRNIANFKTNGEMKNTMYNFDLIPAAGNAKDGFVGRFTISKLGAVARLRPGEDLQVIIQDPLQTLLLFAIQAQGSEVVD